MENPERFFSPKVNTEFDAARAKIIIGDFLARYEEPCSAAELREILTVNDTVIAYFTYVEAYEQMLGNGMIEVDKNGCVRLTETGKQLISETGRSLRRRAISERKKLSVIRRSHSLSRTVLSVRGVSALTTGHR